MVTKKEWSEFRKTGLLLVINQILHIFGWAIVFEIEIEDDTEKVTKVYPARVKLRGFGNDSVTEEYKKVSEYMDKNSKELLKEASE